MYAHLRATVLLALVASGDACERGCLARWMEERGVGGAAPESSGRTAPPGSLFSGTDCSDGLLRCVDGRVEASRTAHLPQPCGSPGKEKQAGCVCPWDVVASCASGCAEPGLEVLGAAEVASQLCRADAVVARPILPDDHAAADICTTEGIACVDGIVRACDRRGHPARALAYCLKGCHPGVGLDEEAWGGEQKNPASVISILCRRDDAERQ